MSRFRSSQAVPTVGWPANGNSVAGVWIANRATPSSTLSTKTVSLKSRSWATAWRRSGAISAPSTNTPSGLPPLPSGPMNTRRTWSIVIAGRPPGEQRHALDAR